MIHFDPNLCLRRRNRRCGVWGWVHGWAWWKQTRHGTCPYWSEQPAWWHPRPELKTGSLWRHRPPAPPPAWIWHTLSLYTQKLYATVIYEKKRLLNTQQRSNNFLTENRFFPRKTFLGKKCHSAEKPKSWKIFRTMNGYPLIKWFFSKCVIYETIFLLNTQKDPIVSQNTSSQILFLRIMEQQQRQKEKNRKTFSFGKKVS